MFKATHPIQLKYLSELKQERDRQDARFGQQDHTPERWCVILGEEFGEVCRAVYDNTLDPAHLRSELIQVAAVALAWLEATERNPNTAQSGAFKQVFGQRYGLFCL